MRTWILAAGVVLVLHGLIHFSLVLTILDGNHAFAGAVIDAVILGVVWRGPSIARWLTG